MFAIKAQFDFCLLRFFCNNILPLNGFFPRIVKFLYEILIFWFQIFVLCSVDHSTLNTKKNPEELIKHEQ